MKYRNPVIFSDYSDPDVIRVGEDFYMVASSFNHVPGVPVLHSKNLVEWELINYVLPKLPFDRFNKVCHGAGAWAPSIRYHEGKFYCLIPFPDEGIFVSETESPYGEWSPLRPLLEGKGYEDPCPIWVGEKCYVVFAFVKSRIGFNSKLAVFETDARLTAAVKDYKFVYDGTVKNPTIEGPKFYRHGEYFYILAPAGGVTNGWQVALRSVNIYGPYESRTILVKGDTDVNGPHQGALIDLDDAGNSWAFMHFQDMGAFGRVVHLQPAKWVDGWVTCGTAVNGGEIGQPVLFDKYPIDIKTGYKIEPSDCFIAGKLSLVWQTPANRQNGWYELKDGLKLNCVYHGQNSLSDLPQLLMQKIYYKNFTIECPCQLNLVCDGDESGLTVFGKEYSYICVVRRGGQNYIELRKGMVGDEQDQVLRSQLLEKTFVTLHINAEFEKPNSLAVTYAVDEALFSQKFYATPGRWVGAKLGVYARSVAQTSGYNTIKQFIVACTNKE